MGRVLRDLRMSALCFRPSALPALSVLVAAVNQACDALSCSRIGLCGVVGLHTVYCGRDGAGLCNAGLSLHWHRTISRSVLLCAVRNSVCLPCKEHTLHTWLCSKSGLVRYVWSNEQSKALLMHVVRPFGVAAFQQQFCVA